MEELVNICTYKEFKAATDREVLNQAEGFVRLGYLLRKARDTEILRDSGYTSVTAFAEGEYGLTETYVSRYIAINKRYSKGGYSPCLLERFRGYGMAKLAEMLTLSDEVVEALPPELSKADIQEVKREIRQEQEITDLEVMLEGKEQGSEGKNSLEKWMQVYIRENEAEWNQARKQAPSREPEEWVMDFLAPTGIAAKMARIQGEGKLMLTIKGRYAPLEIVNLRTNEKETYSLKECADIMERLRVQEEKAEQERKQAQAEQKKEELEKEEQEKEKEQEKKEKEKKREEQKEKLAPVQETDAKETLPEEEEESRKKKKTGSILAEEEITGKNEINRDGRQMEIKDYPELLPEGYTPPSAYIRCHDGSEVEEKAWRKAKDIICGLYEDISQEDWKLEDIYQKAKNLAEFLEKLLKEE